MSNARRFFSRAVSFHIALAVTFAFSTTAFKASTCPPPPPPLRVLYQQSEKVVVARVESVADDKILEETEERTEISVRKFLSVSATLKGEVEPYVVMYETEYREKSSPDAEPETEASPEGEETTVVEVEEDDYDKFKVGKRLLLFLAKDETGDGYSPVDYRFGVKELSDRDLRVYEKRIEELRSILASPEKQTERTVEWLVRCAEDPATRWEGAYELDLSFDLMEQQARLDDEEKAARESGEVKIPPPNDGQIVMLPARFNFYDSSGDAKFAEILSDSQKERLTDVLLNALGAPSVGDKTENEDLSEGDSALLDLVGRWDDARLAPSLLANLRNFYGANNYDAMRLMNLLAKLLENEKLQSLAEKYEEIWHETDDEETDGESESAEENEDENVLKQEIAENESETVEESASEKPEKTTYKQRREEILSEFIAECETSLAQSIESAKVRQKR